MHLLIFIQKWTKHIYIHFPFVIFSLILYPVRGKYNFDTLILSQIFVRFIYICLQIMKSPLLITKIPLLAIHYMIRELAKTSHGPLLAQISFKKIRLILFYFILCGELCRRYFRLLTLFEFVRSIFYRHIKESVLKSRF